MKVHAEGAALVDVLRVGWGGVYKQEAIAIPRKRREGLGLAGSLEVVQRGWSHSPCSPPLIWLLHGHF